MDENELETMIDETGSNTNTNPIEETVTNTVEEKVVTLVKKGGFVSSPSYKHWNNY